ncbi:MAG: radical SAM protein [Desulfobacterales bacterium]|nr:radical SAM protein [Desulfobacterales bacterium]
MEEAIGEYYLPNLMYKTNSLLGGKPFDEPVVADIVAHWQDHLARLPLDDPSLPAWVRGWGEQARAVTPEILEAKARRLFEIPGGRVTVLPPDARHSDYDVIPVNIADGCLYKCKFCKIKNKKPFTPRSRGDITEQLLQFKALYNGDRVNYNSLFLGEHDALAAPADLICYAADRAYEILEFKTSHMKNPRIYMFGSVDSLLHADPDLFDRLSALPFETWINLGLESADPATLERIGKPITPEQVERAYTRMMEINQRYPKIEMTCNFIMDDGLPPTHLPALMDYLRHKPGRVRPKGSVYLSPLAFGNPSRQVLMDFYHLKTQSRVPLYLYIIQRL